jgi:O-antigen/teichoic acid export membrane protein
MTVQQKSGPLAKVRAMLAGNKDLLRNAGSLAATTGLTSLFGFVFWFIAAREFTRTEVGYGETAVNAMTLLGNIGMFGLGTMLIGELPRRKEGRGSLMMASILAASTGSLVLGLLAGLLPSKFPEFAGTLPRVALFAFGVTLTAGTLVFDEGTIGIMRGGVQLIRNLAMSFLKLAALPVSAFLLHDEFGVGIMLAFVIGTLLSMIPAVFMLTRSGSRLFHRPDWQLLMRLRKVALAHNWLNLAIGIPPKLIPVMVTVAVGPGDSAVFYDAYMITSMLFMVPVHLSTVLFAIASASPELIAEKLRFVLRLSVMIGAPVMAVLLIGAHFALAAFGPAYAQLGTVPLLLLTIGYIPQMPKAQFIAVSRATGKVGRAAAILLTTATCEQIAIFFGGRYGGLDGVSFAYLSVITCEGLLTAPTVLRAAYAATATARATGAFPTISAATRATTGLARLTGPLPRLTGPLPELAGYGHRQETGLAALFALASAAVSEGHTFDVATEVWRTGAFPVITSEPEQAGSSKPSHATTSLDLFSHMALGAAHPTNGETNGATRATRATRAADAASNGMSYRHRQQAGVDALIAIATPVVPEDQPDPAARP